MEHFSMEKWIDFARDVAGAPDKAAMQKHLESGCKQCFKELGLWKHVQEAARHQRALDPPESAVRSIKGAFAVHGPRRHRRGVAGVAKLLFNSSLSPVPAGIRSTASSHRQLLFGVGAYRIDLRIEPQLDSDKAVVVGQVLHSTDPGEGLGALPVALVKGRRVVAETVTSQFGEFNLECDLGGRFQLRVKLPAEELQLALVEPILPPGPRIPLTYDSRELSRAIKRRKKRTKRTY
jgi:hypothetical protein